MLGHNNPPSEIEQLTQRLSEKHKAILETAENKIKNANNAPAVCDDDETEKKFVTLIAHINGTMKILEDERKFEKEPYFSLAKGVDEFFKAYSTPLDSAKKKLTGVVSVYMAKKADAARKEAAEKARVAKEEADRLAAEAAQNTTIEQTVKAVVAAEVAEVAQVAATASVAELSRTRTMSGNTASLRSKWVATITDISKIDLEKLRMYFTVDQIQKALDNYVRLGGREMSGVEIKEQFNASVR